jgi:hypothetical protein
MIEFKKTKQLKQEATRHLKWDPAKQKIRIEDLLQIFVDDISQMKDFLQHVIETYGNENFEKYLKELTALNLYHRLLECYLYLNQNNQSRYKPQITMEQNKIVRDINTFIERYDSKIEKNYVLFLFQIYNYSEGVQGCCERLDLKQELISYYIQKKEPERVLDVCMRYTMQ